MQYDRRRLEDVTVLELRGEFDAARAKTATAGIDALLEAGEDRMVIDLGGLTFLDSAALGYLLRIKKRCRESGGDVVLARPSKFIRRTLETLELRQVFTIRETSAEGVDHFRTGAGPAADPTP